MKNRVYILIILHLLSFEVYAQIEERIIPMTSFLEEQPSAGYSFQAKRITIPKRGNQELLEYATKVKQEECVSCRKEYYGYGLDMQIDLLQAAAGYQIGSGNLYLLEIDGGAAKGLQVFFDKFFLPEGAYMHVYNENKKRIFGAYTSKNQNPDRQFATRILPPGKITIEYFEPNNSKFQAEIRISKLIHVFKNFSSIQRSGFGFGTAGSCTENVDCLSILDEEKKSIALIAYFDASNNLSALCSGFLINSNDDNAHKKPLFMTAAHCSPAANDFGYSFDWTFYFNYESESCDEPAFEPIFDAKTFQGAYLRSKGDRFHFTKADYLLLELRDKPESFAEVSYLGWDRRNLTSGELYNFSHPNGDIKKVAISEDFPTSSTRVNTCTENYDFEAWQVEWQSGVTHPGSSGSPLISAEGRAIGILHGGLSRCSDSPGVNPCGSNKNESGPDWFGKMGHAWNHPNFSHSELLHYLDPLNTNPSYLDTYVPPTTTSGGGGGGGGETITCDRVPVGTDGYRISFEDIESLAFGESVAIDESFMIIGAPKEGAAYIYEQQECGISFVAKLRGDEQSEQFGISVDIDGGYAIVGDYSDSGKGQSHIFQKIGDQWVRQIKFTSDVTSGVDGYGVKVKLSNHYAFVSAPEELNEKGALYIYTRDLSGNYGFYQKVISPWVESYGTFALDVDAYANTLVVSATISNPYIEDDRESKVFVYNYEFNPTVSRSEWILNQTITGNAHSSHYVSIYDKHLFINEGARVRFYKFSNGSWNYVSRIVDEAGENLLINGGNFDVYKDKLVVAHERTGAVLLTYSNNTWNVRHTYLPHYYRALDNFGKSLELGDRFMIIGAAENGAYCTLSGSAYIYDTYINTNFDLETVCNVSYTNSSVVSAKSVHFGGNGCATEVSSGGELSVNASNKVLLKDGFRVRAGGYLKVNTDFCQEFTNYEPELAGVPGQVTDTPVQARSLTGPPMQLEQTYPSSLKTDFSIYPNPTRGGFEITNLSGELVEIEAYDINGSSVRIKRLETTKTLYLETNQKGFFLIRAKIAGEWYVRRLIII